MTRVTGRPIDRILQSYVEQPGAPVLTVETSCTGTNSEIAVSQTRFAGTPERVCAPADVDGAGVLQGHRGTAAL